VGDPTTHILIVEDDETFRASTQMLLEDAGYQCRVAASGEEALPVLQLRKVDLVITDYGLPRMNGIQLIERITELTLPYHPLTILMSGQLHCDLDEQAKQAGAFDVLRKPFDVSDLLAVIANALSAHPRSPKPSSPQAVTEHDSRSSDPTALHNGKKC
jgi:CheY-like chemotaxis protein